MVMMAEIVIINWKMMIEIDSDLFRLIMVNPYKQ